jgi:hypothetical protein
MKKVFAYPNECFKPEMMPFDRLNSMRSSKPPIPIHNKRNMLWDRPLPDSSDQQLFYPIHDELDWRRGGDPFPELSKVHRS